MHIIKNVFCVVFLLMSMNVFSQRSLLDSIARHCSDMHLYRNYNGNILLAKNGKIIFEKSYGYANLETRLPLTLDSRFNICSISKEFTAVAIMVCKEQGLLSLDDTLRHYFPELPYHSVTIRHMLQHTSGIPSTEFLFSEWPGERNMQMTDLIPLLTNKRPPLLNTPGAAFRYSNIPYMLLALIIEKVTLKPYAVFMHDSIFRPAGMDNTTVGDSSNDANKTANYIYDYLSGEDIHKRYFVPADRADWRKAETIAGLVGNSNIFSTIADLMAWQEALNKGRLLSSEVYNTMISATIPAGSAGIQNYGYGFSVNYLADDTLIFHNGGTLGYSTTLRYLKNKDVIIISLANTSRANDPADGILELLNGGQLFRPASSKEKKMPKHYLKKFTGIYEAGGRQFEIELKGDSLFRKIADTPPLRLIPSSSNRLYYSDESDRELIFNWRRNNTVYLLKPDGLSVPIQKIR